MINLTVLDCVDSFILFQQVKTAKAARSAKTNGKASSSESSKSSSKRTSSFHAGSLAVVFLALLIGFLVYLTKEDLGQSHEKIKAVVAEAVTMAEAFLLSLKLVGKLASEFRNTFSPPEAAARVCKPHVQLSSVVFQNSVWRSWSKQVAESMSLPRDGDVPKGTAILLAKTPPVLTSVKEILEAGIEEEECKACIKEFSGKTGGNSKGEIQKDLATFLLECPYGVVVVEDVVTTELLPFHNAMSEQGGLTYNGTSIPGWHATYVLTMAMDESSDVDPSNEEECARTVKAGLVEKLTKRYTVEFANAFRRRIDYVGLGRN